MRIITLVTRADGEGRGCSRSDRRCDCPVTRPLLARLAHAVRVYDRLPGRWQAWIYGDPCWLPEELADPSDDEEAE